MTRDQHDAATLALIVAHIGAILPCQRDMAATLDSNGSRVNHSIARLQQAGLIRVHGLGNCRSVEVIGQGRTLPRYGTTEVDSYRPVEAVSAHLESWSCPRCGVRNCLDHNASFITSGRPGGWQLAAGRR